MNRAQQKLVGAGAVVAALLGFAAVKELSKPGANCKDDLVGWVDARGRWVQAKTQVCDQP
jgi:hypothetical protein